MSQRQPRIRDDIHLDHVRSQPCCVCGAPAPSQAAHIRGNWGRPDKRAVGGAEKPDDRWTVPMCNPIIGESRGCHGDQHHRGDEQAYWADVDVDPFAEAERLWAESAGETRLGQPQKPRRKAKVKNGRGFTKGRPQATASRPIEKWSGLAKSSN